MALAKLSTVFLIERVAAQTRKSKIFLHSIIAFWFIYSTFAIAFQCGIPSPWVIEKQRCVSGVPSISAIALSMVIDMILAGWIVPVLMPLHMTKNQRMVIASLFMIRFV